MINVREFNTRDLPGAPKENPDNRVVHFVSQRPGLSLGILTKLVGKPKGISKDDALDAIQRVLDDGVISAEVKFHAKTKRPFLSFYPASQEPTP